MVFLNFPHGAGWGYSARMAKAKSKGGRDKAPKVRILIGSATALGPGKVELLEGIARLGSISGAAREMGMSYRRAWTLVDTMNRCFTSDLVAANTGGKGGGGAAVTPLGLEVLKRYREMEAKAAQCVAEETLAFTAFLRDPDGDA